MPVAVGFRVFFAFSGGDGGYPARKLDASNPSGGRYAWELSPKAQNLA